jgi:hypothetical protein
MEDEMADERAKLKGQIAEGYIELDLIATILITEVLPALDEIKAEIKASRSRRGLVEMALGEIHTLYVWMAELVGEDKTLNFKLNARRMHLEDRIRNALTQIEEENSK